MTKLMIISTFPSHSSGAIEVCVSDLQHSSRALGIPSNKNMQVITVHLKELERQADISSLLQLPFHPSIEIHNLTQLACAWCFFLNNIFVCEIPMCKTIAFELCHII